MVRNGTMNLVNGIWVDIKRKENKFMESQFYFWGPLLFHTKIEEEDINKINDLCIKNSDLSNNKNLAGHINEQYIINYLKLEMIINNHLLEFKSFYSRFYGNYDDFYISGAWVNYMKRGEYNPIHTHTCDLSGVLFISVPKEIKEENEKFIGTGGRTSGAGELKFVINTPIKNFINEKNFFPERGDLFIFPANLMHTVAPFRSDVERVSVAFNMKKKENNANF